MLQADDALQSLSSEKRHLTESNKSLLQSVERLEDARRKAEALTDDLRSLEEEKEEETRRRKQWESTAATLKRELRDAKEEAEDLRRDLKAVEEEAAGVENAKKKLEKGESRTLHVVSVL